MFTKQDRKGAKLVAIASSGALGFIALIALGWGVAAPAMVSAPSVWAVVAGCIVAFATPGVAVLWAAAMITYYRDASLS